ncbi:type VI secretion system protein TssA [Loktanella sp. M215]|uniref:type VI secretion system protein TssA n=1 Tax=Loktanella sp. M215 TaxID=2675431 RepID=UPI001F2F4A76
MDLRPESLDDAAPSGPNVEYEPIFVALEMAAQGGEERQAGDTIIEAEPPDYDDVSTKALAVLEQSHDLRAAAHLALAQIHVNGLPGLADVIGYVRQCLEDFWDTCHPQLDADDDNDPTMRVNAVLALSGAAMQRAIRLAPLTRSAAFGMASLRDLEIVNGDIRPAEGEDAFDGASLSAAFRDTKPEVLQDILCGARGALDDLKSIDAVFDVLTPGQGPDLAPAQKLLQRAVGRLLQETGGAEHTAKSEAAPDVAPVIGGVSAPVSAPAAPAGAISSSADVSVALDRILAYYARFEPSSPLPLLLDRAKRLVGADFVTIMKDIAPGGMESVKIVGGLPEDED